MKPTVRLFLTIGISCLTYADISPSSAVDFMWPVAAPPPRCITGTGAWAVEGNSRCARDIKVADDYCNMRCDQQFNYCRFRDEPMERCVRRLATCRSRC